MANYCPEARCIQPATQSERFPLCNVNHQSVLRTRTPHDGIRHAIHWTASLTSIAGRNLVTYTREPTRNVSNRRPKRRNPHRAPVSSFSNPFHGSLQPLRAFSAIGDQFAHNKFSVSSGRALHNQTFCLRTACDGKPPPLMALNSTWVIFLPPWTWSLPVCTCHCYTRA